MVVYFKIGLKLVITRGDVNKSKKLHLVDQYGYFTLVSVPNLVSCGQVWSGMAKYDQVL